jgi:uncharacterized membrane protein YdjX (TVP38/TMEM64 family)
MKKYLKYIVLAVFIVGVLLGVKYKWYAYLTEDNIVGLVNAFGIWGPMAYIVLYYFAILLFLPATVFTILAGALFGNLLGSVYVVIAATASAQTAFFIARWLGKDGAKKFSGGGNVFTNLIQKIDVQVSRNGFQAFFILRCLFLPYIPLSYAAGVVPRAKAKDFFFATFLTNMIFSPAFVYFGDQLSEGPKALILPVILIILVLSIPKIVKRFRKKS